MTGTGCPRVDAQPVREHVHALMRAGASLGAIADAAAVDMRMVRRLVEGTGDRGPSRRIEQFNAECLLRLTVDDLWECVGDAVFVDGTGARRRVQALACEGWPLAVQGRRCGMTKQGMDYLLRSPTVRAATARAFRRFYAEAQDQAPPSATVQDRRASGRTRTIARRKGWSCSWAWDDDTIDDPDARPAEFERATAEDLKLGEDAAYLIDTGMSMEAVADYFHQKFKSVEKAVHRYRVRMADVVDIRAAHSAGTHVDDIAERVAVRSGHVFGLLLGTLDQDDDEPARVEVTEPLRPHEREVAALARDGVTTRDISARLGIGVRTVEKCLTLTYRRFGIRGRAGLAAVDLDAMAAWAPDATMARSA